MADEETTRADRGADYLKQLNSESIPPWARGMSLLLTGLVGFILALGLNLGDIVNRYMDSRNQIESTTLSQNGQLEVNALSGLIDSNKGLTQHVTDLILSLNTLIDENKRLTVENENLLKERNVYEKTILDLENNNTKLSQENQDLKTRLELKQ